MRVGLHAPARGLAAVVHPRLPRSPRGRDRGGRRDHPQPPLPRRVALAGHRRGGADLPQGRAARVRRGDRARARRRRLLSGHQRGRVRRLRRGQGLQRPALVPARRAERGPRPVGLRQRAHRVDEPRRHERDDGRLPARQGALPQAGGALRRGHRDVGCLRLDGLLGEDAARRDREDPRRRVRGAHRLARRRRAQPGRSAARGDEGDRGGRPDHDRRERLERGGAHGLQRAARGVAARGRVLRDPHAPARRGHLPGARPAERRDLPLRGRGRAEGDDLQPELPARLLLALLPDPAGDRQHDPRARRR